MNTIETERELKQICRHCGALLGTAGSACWYCHRTLADDDIIRVERTRRARPRRTTPTGPRVDVVQNDTRMPRVDAVRETSVEDAGMPWATAYHAGVWITGLVVFLVAWLYAVAAFGFFIGLGLGWFPALVIAVIAGVLWPLIALAVIAIATVVAVFVVGR